VSERDDDGGPAFPQPLDPICNAVAAGVLTPDDGREIALDATGMSLRDYFAAKIIAARLSYLRGWPTEADKIQALAAYQLADEMLRARKE